MRLRKLLCKSSSAALVKARGKQMGGNVVWTKHHSGEHFVGRASHGTYTLRGYVKRGNPEVRSFQLGYVGSGGDEKDVDYETGEIGRNLGAFRSPQDAADHADIHSNLKVHFPHTELHQMSSHTEENLGHLVSHLESKHKDREPKAPPRAAATGVAHLNLSFRRFDLRKAGIR